MRVVALFRVSTEKQAAEGASLDAQERVYREMALKYGWSTVAEFRGHESATQASSDRRVLQQVLACIRERDVDAVYVHEQSRLTRGDELEVAMLMRELKERRVKVIINGVVRDLESIDERFMVGIQSLVDRAESERIKERLMRGKKQRARQGKKASGPAPFGYRNPPRLTPGHGTLQVNPDEAVVVRRIFELYASGKGHNAIASDLNQRGMLSSRGGHWGRTSVHRVLTNRAYIGIAATNVWVSEKGSRTFRLKFDNPGAIIMENAHEPIIPRELWDAVQARPRLPRTAVPRILTGVLFINGRPAAGDSDGRKRFYRGPRGTTEQPWLLADDTDERVWSAFTLLAAAPEHVEKLMDAARNPEKQKLAQQEVTYLRGQVGKLERRLATLLDMRSDGEISKDEYLRKADEAKVTLERTKVQLAEQQAAAAVYDRTHAARVVRAVRALLAGHVSLTTEQKRRILTSLVRRIDIEATYTPRDFKRGPGGKILPGHCSRWSIQRIAFAVTLPTAAAGAEVAGDSRCNGAIAQNASTPNGRQRGAPGALTGAAESGEFRPCQLRTTSSCSAPPEPGRR